MPINPLVPENASVLLSKLEMNYSRVARNIRFAWGKHDAQAYIDSLLAYEDVENKQGFTKDAFKIIWELSEIHRQQMGR
jgi:hypothetical protein